MAFVDRPVIYLLLGYPGTGKLTVGRELVRQLEAAGHLARLVDNHLIAAPIFEVLPQADGRTPLPNSVLDRSHEVATAVMRTIEELSPAEWSFVFTNHLIMDARNERYVEQLAALATRRSAAFVPVVLRCDLAEHLTRVDRADRRGKKLTDPLAAAGYVERGMFVPGYDTLLEVDITTLPPPDAARRILAHTAALS